MWVPAGVELTSRVVGAGLVGLVGAGLVGLVGAGLVEGDVPVEFVSSWSSWSS